MTTEDTAAQESGLAAEYQHDEKLLRFYMKKLLQRNWSGSRTQTEKRFCSLVWAAKRGAEAAAVPLPNEVQTTCTPKVVSRVVSRRKLL
jgi:hypothetical protein